MAASPVYRVLVTGANGFVGQWLLRALDARFGGNVEILATSRSADVLDGGRRVEPLDVADPAAVTKAISRFQPSHVVNLAGLASPNVAASNPQDALASHFGGVLNLGYAILDHVPSCALLNIGTGMSYGGTAASGDGPLTEDAPLAPLGIYDATKAAGDMAAGALALRGLRSIRFRPFNHSGPGQTTGYAVPRFANQIARIEAGLQNELSAGNRDAQKDFLDVRDVVDAYVLAIEKSQSLEPGVVLNISSGNPVGIQSLLDRLLAMSTCKTIAVVDNPEFMKPDAIPYLAGDSTRARQLLGWKPSRTVDQMLADVLDDCRRRVREGA